jgi:hypothetical protein
MIKAPPTGRSRRRLGRLGRARAVAPARPALAPVGWRERQKPGPQNHEEFTEPRRIWHGNPSRRLHRAVRTISASMTCAHRGSTGFAPSRAALQERHSAGGSAVRVIAVHRQPALRLRQPQLQAALPLQRRIQRRPQHGIVRVLCLHHSPQPRQQLTLPRDHIRRAGLLRHEPQACSTCTKGSNTRQHPRVAQRREQVSWPGST